MRKRLLSALLLALGLCLAAAGAGPAPASARTAAMLAYAAWAPNTWYAVGARVTYNGVDYECIQAHTSLTGWEPPIVPALWKPLGSSGGDTTAPSVPGNLRVTGTTSSSVSLAWNASTDNVGVTGYQVYRGGQLVATVSGTTYTDGGLASGTTYSYTVRARDAAGNVSAAGAAVSATTGSGAGVPGQPGAPSITGTTDTSISLSWAASSGTVTGYRVYEGTTQRAQVTGTTATIGSLGACTTHTFTVRAYNSAGESPASAAVTGTTTGCSSGGALPKHILTGYWHNFVNPAVELRLSQVPRDYDVVAIAFGEATATPGQVTFSLDSGLSAALGGYTDAQFRADVQALRQRGQKVILSVGGEAGRVQVNSAAAATAFANSVYSIMQSYGFDGVDIDLENGLNATYMAQALRELRAKAGSGLIIMMAPQTIDMQTTGMEYFKLALSIKDILTVVNTQYYNSGTMLGCDQKVYGQGTVDFVTALACVQMENGLRPDQVGLGLPAGPGAAGGGVVSPATVTNALNCLARRVNCGSFVPPRTYPDIRGAMTWSINWDASNNWNFSRTVKPFLATLP
ncbi:chitinase [Microbispora rosea subsp. aerata]|nr:glycosyl hydrolase family 18 protein [Microbispora rosea]GGO27290.1 chitinase [Microbispora rosea subsp. aerata]GIH57623.1 chitinase [Microbispora rosea subsp. aerata]GLJ86801.1 chitinase [Microbispora rosea subsp. aerata]